MHIIESCWNILRAIDEFEKDNKELSEYGAIEDLLGDIQAPVSDILYYTVNLLDCHDISNILKSTQGDNENE